MIDLFEPASHTDAMERLFRERPNVELPMPSIAHCTGCYTVHSVVHRLRRSRGMTIINTKRRRGKTVLSSYKFIPDESPPKEKDPRSNAGPSSDSL